MEIFGGEAACRIGFQKNLQNPKTSG